MFAPFVSSIIGRVAGASTAITFMGSASGSTSATLPAHQSGDLILVFFQNQIANAPSPPAGYTSISSLVGASNAIVTAYKVATSSSETTGTWRNLSTPQLLVHIYRGTHLTTPIGGNSTFSANSGTSINYNGITLVEANKSWVVGFAGANNASSAIETPPSGMINRSDYTVTSEIAGHDTNGAVAAFSTQSVTVGGTASWGTSVVEIRAVP